MKFGFVLLFASFVVGTSELLKREKYCEIENIEVCRIQSKIQYFSCGKPFYDDNDAFDYDNDFEYEEHLFANLTQCYCELGQDYYTLLNECHKQCGFDDNETPEVLHSSMCSEVLRMKESSYIGVFVSSFEVYQSQILTETEGWYTINDILALRDEYNSDDLSSQISSVLKSISDSQRTNGSIKSHTTTKGSSSNLAVTVGCGSLFSLILLSLL